MKSAQLTHLEEFPYRLECGTLNLVGVAGLNAGVNWVLQHGIENIHQKELILWNNLRKGIQDIEGVITYCANSSENRNPVLSFNIKGLEAGEVGTILDVDYNIACRTGLHCAPKVHEQLGTDKIHGSVRLSIGAFNTNDHIEKAIEAVKEIAAMKK